MMRTFVSINIPEKIKRDILEIQNQLPDFYGKKTKPENLHLTLKFLGEISEDKLEQVERDLHKIQDNSFEAEINSIGIFSEDFIRIVWLNLKNCKDLQRKIDDILSEIGFEKEQRFVSHLTIARVKSVRDKEKFLNELKKIKIFGLKFNVDSFYLMKSELSSEGPIYSVIEKYNLFSEKYKQ